MKRASVAMLATALAVSALGSGCGGASGDLFANSVPIGLDGSTDSSLTFGVSDDAGACGALDDPKTGCGSSSCAPCAIAHGKARCAAGKCAVLECERGRADCNGDPSDGCEVDLASDPLHCAECKTVCAAGLVCGPDGCAATCPGTLTNCGRSCVDLSGSADHCGSCATKCSAPANGVATCTSSRCTFTCDVGYHACGDACVAESASSCGDACAVCPQPANSTALCTFGGTCAFSCNAGQVLCQGGTACCAAADGDGGSTNECGASQTCQTPVVMGSVSGDTDSASLTRTGNTAAWFKATITEDDNSLFDAPVLSFTATLVSPPGMDFDLYVYDAQCGAGARAQGDSAKYIWPDTPFGDGRDLVFEVRYVSGGECGSSWKLKVAGHT